MRTLERQEEWLETSRATGSNGTSRVVNIKELEAVKLESEHRALISIERTFMSPRGGLNRRDDRFKLFFPESLCCQCPSVRLVVVTGQTGHSLTFTRGTGQTGVAQCTCKNNFKILLTSSTNQTWCVAIVDDHKQGNEPCIHK
jgi:hypothetical protein